MNQSASAVRHATTERSAAAVREAGSDAARHRAQDAVITAMAAWIAPQVSARRWRDIAAEFEAHAPAAWEPAVWRPWFASYAAAPAPASCRTHVARRTPGPATNPPGARRANAHAPGVRGYGGPFAVAVDAADDLSGIAARVATMILDGLPAHRRPGVIVFCHTTLGEHVSTSVAARLCALAGHHPFAFSVAQQQGASAFTALRLACELLAAEPAVASILIVAAEKWRPPFSRHIDRTLARADGAGALLLERGTDAPGGLRVVDVRSRMVPLPGARTMQASLPPLQSASRARGRCNRGARKFTRLHAQVQSGARAEAAHIARRNAGNFAASMRALAAEILRDHALDPTMITHGVFHPDARAAARLLHLADSARGSTSFSGPLAQPDTHVCLGAADPIVRLARVPGAPSMAAGTRIMACGTGRGDFVGCALLEAVAPGWKA